MHCIEIKATELNSFKAKLAPLGASVSIISRYTERSVRLLDVEVDKDSNRVLAVESQYEYKG